MITLINPNIKHRLTIFMLILFILLFLGCSKDSEQKAESGGQDTGYINSDYETDHYESSEYDGDVSSGDDLGSSCEKHEYIIAPGESETLTFELKLKRSFPDMPAYEKQKINAGDLELKQSLDYWKKLGVEKELVSLDMEQVNLSTTTWGVESEELVEDQQKSGSRLLNISGSINGKETYRIQFDNSGKGVFETIGDTRSVQQVAQLSEEEVAEKLNNNMQIEHPQHKKFTLQITEVPVDIIEYFVQVSFEVTMPSSTGKNTGCESWYLVKVKDSEVGKFCLKVTFDNDLDGMYHVFGPYDESDCEYE